MHARATRRFAARSLFALLLATLASARPAATASELCGTTILTNLTLDQDLICATATALIVGADGVTIDLNGHTLAGAGNNIGILLSGRASVTVRGGTLTRFAAAVRVTASTDVVITHNSFVDNGEGIDFQSGSVANTVKHNQFERSSTRAMMLRSGATDNDIKHNTFTDSRVAILVFGGVNNIIKNNAVSGSTLAGIRINVIATGNLIRHNLLADNLAGMEFILTPTGSAAGNDVLHNTFTANACGLKGATDGNRVDHTTFDGNTADTCA